MPPAQPPEAAALRIARIRQNLSVSSAAERAGVSTSLWRQVEAGYTTPAKGVHAPKIAPAATLARMARAVDLQPDDLESQGHRPDAAAILREMARQQEGSQPAVPAMADGLPPIRRREVDFSGSDPEVKPYLQGVRRDLYAALGILPSFGPRAGSPGGPDLPAPSELPDGGELLEKLPGRLIFPMEHEAMAWDAPELTLREKETLIARLRMLWAWADAEQRRRQSKKDTA